METFKYIIQNFIIQIPIIQRDYAQGRSDPSASTIRENFLNRIGEVLENDETLHLDFIYGSVRNNKFVPLDGQQRLTTLFLLHWYFGKKENKDINVLKKFTYETRASSRDFCSNLIDGEISFTESSLSDQIKDSSWFIAFWENDPTIQSMLTMIDTIHLKFKSNSYYEKLDRLTFNFFELENFGLDDDLYIKMNARGKSLTDFEIFKAKFEKFISGVSNELMKEFSNKIDNQWTDLFWKYGVADKSYLIDKYFMNYFGFITEMLYYKNNKEVIPFFTDFKLIKNIYSDEENIRFLFTSLDKFSQISNCFTSLFSGFEYEENKVAIFDDNINLLEKIITSKIINIQQKIFLFLIISHFIQEDVNNNLRNLLRVVRNLTNRIRHMKTGSINYTGDLSYDQLYYLLRIFMNLLYKDVYYELTINEIERSGSGISQLSLQYEIDKAKIIQSNNSIINELFCLEDYKFTRGDIHNFLSPDAASLTFFNKAIREIYSKNDSLVIRSMLTIEDYSIRIGWTTLGTKYYFGWKSNWEVILTISNRRDYFFKYLNYYKECAESLEEMIANALPKLQTKDWRYYFIKYPEMTSSFSDLSRDSNVYSVSDNYSIEKMGGTNLNAYHLNPYIKVVLSYLEITAFLGRFDSYSYLVFDNLKIYSTKEGWKIFNFDAQKYSSLVYDYNLSIEDNSVVLLDNEDQDRIEILVDFIIAMNNLA